MTDMQRWLDSEQVQEDVLRRLKAARPLLPLDRVTKARSRRRLVVMTAVPVAASLMFWIKSVALGAVLGSAVTVAIVVPKWQQLLTSNQAVHTTPRSSFSKASPHNVTSPA